MNVLLLQLDGSLPNLALMRIAAHHRGLGDVVVFRHARTSEQARRFLWDAPDVVYASMLFSKSRKLGQEVINSFQGAIVGGSGWDLNARLEQHGITTQEHDYSLYPRFRQSIGYTSRGCRRRCSFCIVPQAEGAIHDVATILDVWRGHPHARELILLDNDFFGQLGWRARIRELRDGVFKVCFTQGVDLRSLTDEQARALAGTDYRNMAMRTKRIYGAWDSVGEEPSVLAGIHRLIDAGITPDHIMVYMLIGYQKNETHEHNEYRRQRLREYGVRPYPMPYRRTAYTRGFQRWVTGAYDKRVPWKAWRSANYEPRALRDFARLQRME